MIRDQREPESRRLCYQRRIEIGAAEGLAGLAQRRLQESEVAKSVGAAGGLDDQPTKLEDFAETEEARHRRRS